MADNMFIYPRIKRAERLARRFANRCRYDNPSELYKRRGWLLFSTAEIQKISGRQDPFKVRRKEVDAKTYRRRRDGVYVTIYNETKDPSRIVWTLAHEIGHIVLGHFLFFPEIRRFGYETIVPYHRRRGGRICISLAQESKKQMDRLQARYIK